MQNLSGWLVLLRSCFIISDKEFLEFLLFPLSIIQWLECGTVKKVTLNLPRELCGIPSWNSGCEQLLTITSLPPDKGEQGRVVSFFIAADINGSSSWMKCSDREEGIS